MKISKMPDAYIGKEQAYIKHTILKTYLQRLFMIVGRKKEEVINYVDCFAGPWQAGDEDLADTSIGVSIEQMISCQQSLRDTFSRNIRFRALYIEKDPKAFIHLQEFLSQKSYPDIEIDCLNGDYTDLLDQIVSWCGKHFTFFFIDPTGWQNVVGAKTMLPLLQLDKVEFLINLMYDFINRFVGKEIHADDMVEIFGDLPAFNNETPEQRQRILLSLYRNNLKKNYSGGRTAYVTIQKPGLDRVLYYLVYLTRHPVGLDAFKAEAEKMDFVQRTTQREYKLRQQIEGDPTGDLFGSEIDTHLQQAQYSDNRFEAKEYLLKLLSSKPIVMDHECWADILESTDLYPTDLQLGMKELLKENLVNNLDADVSRRRTKLIRPDWPGKSERWSLVGK